MSNGENEKCYWHKTEIRRNTRKFGEINRLWARGVKLPKPCVDFTKLLLIWP